MAVVVADNLAAVTVGLAVVVIDGDTLHAPIRMNHRQHTNTHRIRAAVGCIESEG